MWTKYAEEPVGVPEPDRSMEGATIGSYRVSRTLGRGGMGAVYLAEHILLGRSAAIKVLLPMYSQDPQIVTRFFNEARAATAIRHPGIVEIYDFGFHEGRAYIAMELLDGESLGARLERGPLSMPAAIAITRQIAGVLAAAHAEGIVHRDLKPDNIFLVPDPEVRLGYRVKLLDFGIAKLMRDDGKARKTHTGAIIGTPSYMAPEQCRGVAVDYRADYYSLGCILFETITSLTPFRGEGVGDVLAAHIYAAPPEITSLVSDVPQAAAELIRRLLEKDPNRRPQSTSDIIAMLDTAAQNASVRSSSQPRPRQMSGTLQMTTLGASAVGDVRTSRPRHRRIAGVAAAAGVACLAVIGALLAGSNKRQRVAVEAAAAAAAFSVDARDENATSLDAGMVSVDAEPLLSVDANVDVYVDVTIESRPLGADVLIGGEVVGRTPYHGEMKRTTDVVNVVVRRAGHKDAQLSFAPSENVTRTVTLLKTVVPSARASSRTDPDGSLNPFPSSSQ